MIRTVRLLDVQPQPWRNGGGSTCELLAWPLGSSHWQCRISVARIEKNGPFSAFPGVERWFAVVQGEGVVLRFANRRALLSVGSEPLRFEGASAPQCDLLDGATQDLNLMAQSASGRAGMFTVKAGEAWDSSAPLRGVYTAHAVLLLVGDEPGLQLPAHTLAYSEQAAHQLWRLSPIASATATPAPGAWWLQFKPRTP
jgi:uncharacterized protein